MACGVPEGYRASGSRGKCSSERVSSRGNRGCRVQHACVPDTSVPENETVVQTIKIPNTKYEKINKKRRNE